MMLGSVDQQPSLIPKRFRLPTLIGWALIAALYVALFIVGLSELYQQTSTLTPTYSFQGFSTEPLVRLLVGAGLSLPTVGTVFVIADILGWLVFASVGILIVARRSNEWIGVYSSAMLIALGTAISLSLILRTTMSIAATPLAISIGSLGFFALFIYLTIFPDGRFVPHWTMITAVGGVLWLISGLIWPRGTSWNEGSSLLVNFAMVGVGLFSAIYRYVRVSDLTQRLQTKWVVLAFAVALILALFWGTALQSFSPLVASVGLIVLVRLGYALIPIAIGIAVLRYRLWEIDLLINRGLVYSILTGLLVAIYFLIVTALQFALRWLSGQESPLAIVVSTLAIAALFNPLWQRIQGVIDRRLYRRKYDAARTLETFGATVRDEVDLSELSSSLLEMANRSLQPSNAKLWLREHKEVQSE
jgi:hypothetical protein